MAHRNTKNLIPHSKQGRSLYQSFPTYKEQKHLMTSPDTKDDKTEKKEQTYRQTGLTTICFQKQYNLI